ncbi:hypothetical protein NAPIS_ORF01616 [Vairimorpha apis BRL 01]|uniref:Uncharacterized protein n=1 Tax=Vairimorpha apis BRL 01 TaxID=1037528 RepID=T0MCF4_9MICR|nr:hypothetical protein NAPIS_ORF01616 [Vairimorpha apis BRL 01]
MSLLNYNESTVNETVLKNNFNESNVNVSELNNHNYNDSTVNETESNESSISEPAASEYSSSETTASETTSGDSSDDDSSVNEITEKNEAIIRDNETESFANNNIIPESSSTNYNNETTNDSCFSSENLPTSSTIPQQKKLVCTGQKGCPCESCSSKLPNSKFSFTDKSQIKNNIDINNIIKDSSDVNDNKNQKIDLKNTGNNNFFEKACTNKNNDKIINPLYNYTKISTASTNIEEQKSFSPIIQTPLPLNSSFSICQKQPQESSTNFHQQTDSSISKKQYDDFLTLKQRKEGNFKNDLLSKTTNSDDNKICTRNKELNDNENNLIDYDLDEETIDDVDREKKSSYLSSSKRKFKRKSFSISSRYRKNLYENHFYIKKRK